MSASRRFHLGLPATLDAAVRDYSCRAGLGVGQSIRLLVSRGLELEARGLEASERANNSPAALAALLAVEHAVLMVASVLPEGERRMRELGARASEAAEQRLALFSDPQPSGQ